MFCSTVIPTIARAALSRAVQSVLDQDFSEDDFEVIVVNDSGSPLPEEDWQRSTRVTVIHTNRRERSFARNTGAAVARGMYVHFLDDDDWLLPGALQSFWKLAQTSQAHWLYGGSQLVDRKGKMLIQLHHCLSANCFVQAMAGEWIPLQSSLIRTDEFFAVGGFTPLINGVEDVDLLRRIALTGDLACMDEVVACIGMGVETSSTDHSRVPNYSRWAREKILNEPGVWKRLQTSANTSEWKGRIARIYLTSLIWNLQQRNVFAALSRGVFAAAAVGLGGRHLLSLDFWQGMAHSYQSHTFLRGFQEAQKTETSLDRQLKGWEKAYVKDGSNGSK